jgi:hypothetical protein
MAARRGELIALIALAACLVAGRALAWDALAVWAAAGLLLVAPGWCALRAVGLEADLGRAGAAPVAAALSLAVWTPPLAAAYLLGLTLTFVIAAVIAATALLALAVRGAPLALPRAGAVEVAGGALATGAFAYLAWRISTPVVGDALFHVGLMRRLGDVSSLSFASVSPFLHGPPNAGYALPVLQGAFEGVAKLAGADPVVAFRYLLPPCAGLAIASAYALARALTGWRSAGYLAAAMTAWDLCSLINGLVLQINQPPPFSLWVLTPAALLLFWLEIRHSRRAALATVSCVAVIAFVHPTYAIPCLAIAAGMLAGAWRAGLPDLRAPLGTLVAMTATVGGIAGWIWWEAIRGGHRHPVLSHADEFVIRSGKAVVMYPWAPVFGRGYVLLAILAMVWLVRYRPLLPAVGGAAALLVVLLLPGLNTLLIDAVGMGQFHRFWQALPWPVIGAAGACTAGVVLGRWSWAVAVVLAVAFHEVRGVDQFWHWPVGIAVVLALIATLLRLRLPIRDRLPGGASPAAVVLVAGALAAFVANWAPTVWREARAGPYRGPPAFQTVEATPGAIAFFRDLDGPPPVVLAAPDRAFELFGLAGVRTATLPEARTRALPRLDESERNHLGQAFFSPESTDARRLEVLRALRVDYVVVDLRDQPPDTVSAVLRDPALEAVYRDPPAVPSHLGRFVILRVRP